MVDIQADTANQLAKARLENIELKKEAATLRQIFTRGVGKEVEQVSDAMIVGLFTKLRQQVRNIDMKDWDLTEVRLGVPSQNLEKTDRAVGLKKWRLQDMTSSEPCLPFRVTSRVTSISASIRANCSRSAL